MSRRRSKPETTAFTPGLRALFRLPNQDWEWPEIVQVAGTHRRCRVTARFRTPEGAIATGRVTINDLGTEEASVSGEGLAFRWTIRR